VRQSIQKLLLETHLNIKSRSHQQWENQFEKQNFRFVVFKNNDLLVNYSLVKIGTFFTHLLSGDLKIAVLSLVRG
jgi:hypothetical protein